LSPPATPPPPLLFEEAMVAEVRMGRDERGAEVGDENEQRPLIGGFLSRFAGSGGNEEGTGRRKMRGVE